MVNVKRGKNRSTQLHLGADLTASMAGRHARFGASAAANLRVTQRRTTLGGDRAPPSSRIVAAMNEMNRY
jgi:hypothetical protein